MVAVAKDYILSTVLSGDNHETLIVAQIDDIDIIFLFHLRAHDVGHCRLDGPGRCFAVRQLLCLRTLCKLAGYL